MVINEIVLTVTSLITGAMAMMDLRHLIWLAANAHKNPDAMQYPNMRRRSYFANLWNSHYVARAGRGPLGDDLLYQINNLGCGLATVIRLIRLSTYQLGGQHWDLLL